MAGRTTAWDLSSLVIKPVQRVLKYPLLLRELRKETPENDPDYDNLTEALERMQTVAEKINQVKKRQDIVEKTIEKKNANVIHGFNKKISRGAQQIKNVTLGFDEGEDQQAEELYLSLRSRFDIQNRSMSTLMHTIQSWYYGFKETINVQMRILVEFEDVVSEGEGSSLVKNILIHIRDLVSFKDTRLPEIQEEVDRVKGMVESLEKLYRNPLRVMKKRDAKQLDHYRLIQLQARGEDDIDKQLIESSESFIALNQHLAEELPKLLKLCQEYVDCCIAEFSQVQARSIGDLGDILGRSVGDGGYGFDADMLLSELTIMTLSRERSPKKGMSIYLIYRTIRR